MKSETSMSEREMQPLLKIENLAKWYVRQTFAGAREEVLALDGVSLTMREGTTLAVVGESGSGKSTLGLCVACQEEPTSGSIWFDGKNIVNADESERRKIRPQVQIIFQDPANSLNPRWTVGKILREPLVLRGKLSREELKGCAHSLLEGVGLSSGIIERSPMELSGGQRQRVAIARALALEPRLLILDEALSALDCSVQAQIANLLMELQSSLGMTYLFITHDLAMGAHLADEIAVMSRGRIAEHGATEQILQQPQTEILRQLLAAVPRMTPATFPSTER
jgi:ABC-type glutathione transport system ATPase component